MNWRMFFFSEAGASLRKNALFERKIVLIEKKEPAIYRKSTFSPTCDAAYKAAISDDLILKFDSLIKKNKGNLLFKLQLVDIANEQQLAMLASKKVAVSSELLAELEQLGLNYKLN